MIALEHNISRGQCRAQHKLGSIPLQEITWHGTRYCRLPQLTHYTRQRLRRTQSSVFACGCHCANVDDSAPVEH